MPDDQLALAALGDDDRRTVAQLGPPQRQRLPDFLAAVLVEGDNNAVLAAHQADQAVAIQQRRGSVAPQRHAGPVVFREVLRPQHLALGGIQAIKVAHGADSVDLAVGDQRRGARPDGVADLVGAIVFVLPQGLAAGLVETDDALLAGEGAAGEGVVWIAGALGELAVHDEDLAAGDGRPGVAAAQRCPPLDLRPLLGKLVEDALLAPDAIAFRPQPLRPVVGPRRGCPQPGRQSQKPDRPAHAPRSRHHKSS